MTHDPLCSACPFPGCKVKDASHQKPWMLLTSSQKEAVNGLTNLTSRQSQIPAIWSVPEGKIKYPAL